MKRSAQKAPQINIRGLKINVLGKDSVKVLFCRLFQCVLEHWSFHVLTNFAFAHSPLDRCAALRSDALELEKRGKSSTARFVYIHGDNVLFAGDTLDVSQPKSDIEPILLGADPAGLTWFAVTTGESDSLNPIRNVMIEGLLSPAVLSIVAQARSMVHWHQSHGFCAKCGSASIMKDAGYRRHCAACGSDHFPRTDPVVIMAVCHGRKTLLGRQKAWPENMYSTLAGFMEPGETIEDAVRREVKEEVGVTLGKVDYVASQPWPFPASLMIGMIGEAENDTLTIDETEIETARWFEADELKMMIDRTHPQGLHASRPDAIAWHLAQAALKRITA
jgi:NAD+ diphosphatase